MPADESPATRTALVYDEGSKRWNLLRASRKSPKLCSVLFCRNAKPATGCVCSRCLMRRWRANNPVVACFQTLCHNAKKRGIPVLMTVEQFTEWVQGTQYMELRGRSAHSLTVERRDATRGYELSNITILTNAANAVKGATLDKRAIAAMRARGITMIVPEPADEIPASIPADENCPF